MALLNFATSYNGVADKLKLAQSETGDYIKLYSLGNWSNSYR